ncbi:hypothetical protein RGUI_3173 [Rhodovulum sp. P5]|uniref:capsular polysaccharide export protein, LipB/KpsS family n=1 Tax=Rhodovulum sp. P5 TaxID=1564506 RepID=UPI0009C36697|nr:hypothetical protein [Rhodovulum sp. P5]ARE41314.1 hypothetical protein RGUI_3173 [Rhodovulum sp. P5]
MRILIQCGDNLENTRRVLALAVLLRQVGHDPVAGVYTAPYAAPFEAMGIDTVALHPLRPARLPKDPAEELGFEPDIFEMLPVERALARLEEKGNPMAEKRGAVLKALFASARAVRETEADALVVWNGVTGHFANAFSYLKSHLKMPGGFIERGPIPDGLFFDPLGTNGASSLADGAVLGAAERDDLLGRHAAALWSHFPFLDPREFAGRASAPRGKQIFVPLQVQGDSNILLYSQHIKSMRRLVIEAITLRDRWFPDHEIVVRPHPEESRGRRLNLPQVPGLRVTSDGSLTDHLQVAPITVTVNSTVGLEAAWHGSLPVVYGDGIYGREPFVLRQDPGAPTDPAPILSRLRDDPVAALEAITDFMLVLLDRHLVQPLRATESRPEALLKAFAPPPVPDRRSLSGALSHLRGAFAEHSGPLHCHVLTERPPTGNLDYRRIGQPVSAPDIDRMLRALFMRDTPFVARRGAWSDQYHVAIADPDTPADRLRGYRAVVTPNFGVHPIMRTPPEA